MNLNYKPHEDLLKNPLFIHSFPKQPKQAKNTLDEQGLFAILPANRWLDLAKSKPIPKMLFGEFWHEGEICILFADTNVGKSILAMQIADSITTGKQIGSFALEALMQKVLYFDFELSEKQFEARYSEKNGDVFSNHYLFSADFLRGEINPEHELPEGFPDFESYLNRSLEQAIVAQDVKVLIVDNLTYLRNETERAKDALPLMKQLKHLKKKYNLSILALAHTPKRDNTRPLTINDLQGSKMLANFADSIFAIGQSHKDKNFRYLKQLKARNTGIIYDAENVCICQITKPENFLKFEYLHFGSEHEHLKELTDKDRVNRIEQAKELDAQNKTQREIAKELGVSVGTVNNYLKK